MKYIKKYVKDCTIHHTPVIRTLCMMCSGYVHVVLKQSMTTCNCKASVCLTGRLINYHTLSSLKVMLSFAIYVASLT